MSSIQLSNPNTPFQWIDITAPVESELIAIAEEYGIHSYLIRDCLEPEHLPKFESQDDYNFIITRMMIEESQSVNTIQQATSKVALFYSEHFILTIHRLPIPFVEDIKSKYVDNLHTNTPAELVVRVLWYVLQSYVNPSIKLANEIDIYEEKIFLKNLSPIMMKNLYYLKRKTHIASKLLMMNSTVVNNIESPDRISLQDLKDTQHQLQNTFNQNQEDVNNVVNFYLSLSSQKTNEVMRILTVFSAFFLPLTFIVGVYGMNFKYMPELELKQGYWYVWIAMIATTVIIYLWFRRKKWM